MSATTFRRESGQFIKWCRRVSTVNRQIRFHAIVRKANGAELPTQRAEAVSACDSAIEMIKRADEKDPTLFESMSDEETCQELQQIVERAKRCAHDDDPTDCNQCMIESDIAFDAMRERGSR